MQQLIFIDPGFHTGWAVFNEDGSFSDSGEIFVQKNDELENRLLTLDDLFNELVYDYDVKLVQIESVEPYHGVKGNAAKNTGSTIKLAYIVGIYIAICADYSIDFNLIPAYRWKGQLPDAVVKNRVEEYMGMEFKSQHECDAVGMGLKYFKKLFM